MRVEVALIPFRGLPPVSEGRMPPFFAWNGKSWCYRAAAELQALRFVLRSPCRWIAFVGE